jgi:hypothetical protein
MHVEFSSDLSKSADLHAVYHIWDGFANGTAVAEGIVISFRFSKRVFSFHQQSNRQKLFLM